MNIYRSSKIMRSAALGALALAVVWVSPAQAFAQDFTPNQFVSSLSGLEVNVTGPVYQITSADAEKYRNGSGEVVNIDSDLSNAEVSFFDDTDTPDDSINAYLEGIRVDTEDFTVVDRGDDGETWHALTTMTYQDIDFVYYVQVTQDITGNVDLFQAQLSFIDTFESDIATAQEEISIGDDGYMANVDPADLMDMLNGESVSTPQVEPQSTGTPDASDPRTGARLGGTTQTQTPVASYQGENYGHSVTWDDALWQQSEDASAGQGTDRMTLESIGASSTQYVVVIVGETDNMAPGTWLEQWQSEEYLTADLFGGESGDASVIATRQRDDSAGAVIRYSIGGESFIMVRQVFLLEDGTTLLLVVDASETDAVDAYTAAYESVQMDGAELPQLLTPGQVERAIGA